MKGAVCSLLIVPALMGCGSGLESPAFVRPNKADLAQYHRYMEAGAWNPDGANDRLQARAMEMIELNGLPIRPDSEIMICSQGGVPTSVTLDEQEIPIEDLYTAAERTMLGAAKSVVAMMMAN